MNTEVSSFRTILCIVLALLALWTMAPGASMNDALVVAMATVQGVLTGVAVAMGIVLVTVMGVLTLAVVDTTRSA